MKFQFKFRVPAIEMFFKFPNGYPVFYDTIEDNALHEQLDWDLGEGLEETLIPIDGEVKPEFYDILRESYFDTDVLDLFKYDLDSIEVVDAELVDNDCFITFQIIANLDMDKFYEEAGELDEDDSEF